MKYKFKVGDKVKVISRKTHCLIAPVGEIGIIKAINGGLHHPYAVEFKKCDMLFHSCGQTTKNHYGYWCAEDILEPVKNECIVIYRNGNEVVALDKTIEKKASAKCNPSDEFCFKTGAELALSRLFEDEVKGESYNSIKVGDFVEVEDMGDTYTGYTFWSALGAYASHYVAGKSPITKVKYKVLKIAKHDDGCRTLALIQNPNTTQVFIINVKGLKKIEGSK